MGTFPQHASLHFDLLLMTTKQASMMLSLDELRDPEIRLNLLRVSTRNSLSQKTHAFTNFERHPIDRPIDSVPALILVVPLLIAFVFGRILCRECTLPMSSVTHYYIDDPTLCVGPKARQKVAPTTRPSFCVSGRFLLR